MGPEVFAGQIFYPFERAPQLLRFYRDYYLDAPDEVMCYPFFIRVPPIELFPELFHGQVALDFVIAYAGPVEEAEEHVAPFRALDDPFLDMVMPQPYLTLQQSFDAGMVAGNGWYSRSQQLDELTDEAIDALVGALGFDLGQSLAVVLALVEREKREGEASRRVKAPVVTDGREIGSHSGHTQPSDGLENEEAT